MRVLVVKMSSLGDVVHTLPALTDAAAALPEVRFDWVVEESFAEIPAWHPAVDTVIPIALRRWRKQPFKHFRGPEWQRCRTALRAQHYDLVIDAQGLIKSALVARYVGASVYGLDRHSAREGVASWAYHQRVNVATDLHAVERTRRLFARALDYELPQSRGDYGVREHLQSSAAESVAPTLLFFHGSAREEKLWPVAHWQQLAELARDYRVSIPWGNAKEKQRGEAIAAAADNAEVLPRLDLRGLAQLLMQSQAAVAVDTGLGHLAAALDVPTVSLYGPTDTRLIGAYGSHQLHIESPVSRGDTDDASAMMASIAPQQVWSGLQQVMAEAQP